MVWKPVSTSSLGHHQATVQEHKSTQNYFLCAFMFVGLDSSVGIATCYGIESQWEARFFRTRPDGPWGPPSLLYNRYRVFPGSKATGA